ncbi:hypothetical protein AC579_4419 [Pseudocercospora musae]|uniref:Uncharacterized protein n=1 Tax=Pseudocercospora musae TaxID=113226 RepID=A0A139I169_9PEZI|nr:hypothetical protein AC579_4419 [Pseudocercospora musae]
MVALPKRSEGEGMEELRVQNNDRSDCRGERYCRGISVMYEGYKCDWFDRVVEWWRAFDINVAMKSLCCAFELY